MKRSLFFLAVFSASPLFAAEPTLDAEETVKKLAPFIDQHTLLVGRLDVRQFDTTALLALIDPLVPADEAAKKVGRATARAYRDDLIKKGGREIYVVYGASDFPNEPCLLVPIGESPPERNDLYDLLKTLYPGKETAWANINGFLCVGTKAAVDKLKTRKPSPRPDIAEALATNAEAACQIVFVPSVDSRKIFEETAPTVPEAIGGGSIQTFTRGLKWISLGVGPTPKVQLNLTLQAVNAEAAKKLQAAFTQGLDQAKGLMKSVDSQDRAAYLKFYRKVVPLLTPKIEKEQLVVSQELGTLLPEMVNLLKEIQPSARTSSAHNLHRLGLALNNHASTYFDRLPTDLQSKDGKPLLSWRVAILPFIEQGALYQQFKRDEPWDSEQNKKLIPLMPKVFRSPKQNPELKGRTTYLAPLGKGLMWDDPKGVRYIDITDGTSSTILLVESDEAHAVVWTKPEDIIIDEKNPALGLLGHWKDGFHALMCDGSVHFVAKDYSGIWAMFTRAGGEVLPEK